jgi:hypothetical protein
MHQLMQRLLLRQLLLWRRLQRGGEAVHQQLLLRVLGVLQLAAAPRVGRLQQQRQQISSKVAAAAAEL